MSRIKARVLITFCIVFGGVFLSGRSAVQAHENTGTDRKNDTGQKVGSDDGIILPQPDVVPDLPDVMQFIRSTSTNCSL